MVDHKSNTEFYKVLDLYINLFLNNFTKFFYILAV